MNFPKVLTIIIVIAATVILLFPTISAAIPKEMNGVPFSFEMDGSGEVGITMDDNMMMTMSMPDITFGSKLPQDITDVKIDVYLGTWDRRVSVGSYNIDTIPAEGTVTGHFEPVAVSAFFLLCYTADMKDTNGLDFPICVGVSFKYLEWNELSFINLGWNQRLLDVGFIIKVPGTESNGTFEGPEVTGNKSVVTVSPEDGLVKSIGQMIYSKLGGTYSATAGDATIDCEFSSQGMMKITMNGTSGTVYQILNQMFQSTGKITFVHGPNEYIVEGDTALALLNALKMFYPEAA